MTLTMTCNGCGKEMQRPALTLERAPSGLGMDVYERTEHFHNQSCLLTYLIEGLNQYAASSALKAIQKRADEK